MSNPQSYRRFTLAGLVAGFIVGAAALYPIPYNDLDYWSAIPAAIWAIGLVVVAAGLKFWFRTPAIRTALVTSGGLVIALLARIVVEVAIDPTDHNLWPFEVALAVIVSLPSALAGAFFAKVILRIRSS